MTAVDLVVVGSGIAGLFATVKAAGSGMRVAVVTKASLEESSSRYAQGGIAAAVDPDDDAELHAADTLAAGRGLCDPAAVRILVEEGPGRIHELIELGVNFDTQDGVLSVGREAAHSRARIVHAGGDATGREVEQLLARRAADAAYTVLENCRATALLTDGERCLGVDARSLRSGETLRLLAPSVLLATGGLGRCFRYTTNPPPSTGDGLWLAYQAGAELGDLEFVQFHPTALVLPGAPSFLISEAVRGEGAYVIDDLGERFLFAADPAGELAGRDVVARAISHRMEERGLDQVWLDLRPIGAQRAGLRFPSIAATCASLGIDITSQPVPVAPAAHYHMGGVWTDLWGATTLPGLYAAGEVARSGVHGANRLASNSLLETLVFSARAVEAMQGRQGRGQHEKPAPLSADLGEMGEPTERDRYRGDLRAVMWRGAGISRERDGLLATMEFLQREPAWLTASSSDDQVRELVAMRTVSRLVVEAALLREESRGAHYRSDFPETAAEMLGSFVQRRDHEPQFHSYRRPG